MKQLLLSALLLILILSCSKTHPKTAVEPAKIIFDTDFGPDYDDVGALAFLHAMADSGNVEILATISSNKHELVAPGMDVLNTYFGRPNLPVGAPKGNAVNLGAWQHWLDSLVAKFPHKIQTTNEVENAVSVYRRILATQPDSSVTIVTVGFLTNLADLLKSSGDSISSLTGKELILKKVKKLISMAGTFPEGREFNVYMDSTASKYTFENWPTPIIFTGFEIGSKIFTGLRVMKMTDSNPVKDVFRICIPMADEDKNGRMSWDETAVLIGIYGTHGFFDTVRGKMVVNENGSNSWINDSLGNHTYVVQKMPIPEITTFIEDRMMHMPKK
jgi:inosine-uridine nucleoside N-ribohydrolase